MELTITLTGETEHRYWERRQSLLTNPAEILQNFNDQWLRVVGKIEQFANPDNQASVFNQGNELVGVVGYYCQSWLVTTRKTDERDDYNLKLANDESSGIVVFDLDYFVLDPELADRILANGIKNYGVSFLIDFDSDSVDRIFRHILLYGGAAL